MLATRRTNLSQERHRGFVGRDVERERVLRWLTLKEPPTKIVAVTGLGGIGKSTFLHTALEDAKKAGDKTAWIDGRTCFGSAQELLAQLPQAFSAWLENPDTRTRWVLGLDNYESLSDLDQWIREGLLRAAPATHLLVIVCQRAFPLAAWQWDLGWAGRVEEWPLKPFTGEEATRFLKGRGIDGPMLCVPVTPVPLALAIYADLYHGGADPEDMRFTTQKTLSAALLREVVDDSWQEALNALCLVSCGHLDFLNGVLHTPLTVRQYQGLASLSFVMKTSGGLGVHDLVRAELLHDFRARQPSVFHELRKRIMMQLVKEWGRTQSGTVRGRIAHDLVYLVGQDLGEWRAYADLLDDAPGLEAEPYKPEDYPAAIECLREWARPAIPMTLAQQETLFHQVAETFPDTIRVVREPSGAVAAMLCLLPLAPEIMALLDPLVPELAAILAECGLELSQASTNVTRLVAMVGLRTKHPLFGAQILVGYVLRRTLESASGRRILGWVRSPDVKVLLEKLGFVPVAFPTPQHPDLTLYDLDLRFEEVPAWAARLAGLPVEQSSGILTSFTAHELCRLLMASPDSVRFSRLSEIVRRGLSPKEINDALRAALNAFGKHPGRAKWAELLRQSYLECYHDTRHAIAGRLHVSLATYHRHLSRAREEFARFVLEEHGENNGE